MTAYARFAVADFLAANLTDIVAALHTCYAHDGFRSQYTEQTKAWERFVPLLRTELSAVLGVAPEAANWGVLLEYPLYRLRRRIDAVILTTGGIVVLEAKVGETEFRAADARQVEDYALDLRDFHAGCGGRTLIPVLWCTGAPLAPGCTLPDRHDGVLTVQRAGREQLRIIFGSLASPGNPARFSLHEWDQAPYQPVPTIIQAATMIFAEHDVKEIGRADAANLAVSARRIVEVIAQAKRERHKVLVFVTGVPGAGKTLAGLQTVHDARTMGEQSRGDIVYLSGNTPLVTVLREALARDVYRRTRANRGATTLDRARRDVRTRVQHINDFLKEYLRNAYAAAPHEHAIVFDEAQRAWDAKHSTEKFNRNESEPTLLLEIMGRHPDWSACVALVGGGQEINTGEEGIRGWGFALRALGTRCSDWTVYGPADVFEGGVSTGGLSLGELPPDMPRVLEPDFRLSVPIRSYRSPALSEWVTAVLDADLNGAKTHFQQLTKYPVFLTRSLGEARAWLRAAGRGERRYGLLASSGARRLRADGLGEILKANHGLAIAQWYLNDRDDIRSSFVLEVPANEYACQGLEVDFAGVCWGGDLIFDTNKTAWICRRLSGNSWNVVSSAERQRYIKNKYRVLLTRAREGLVIWIPKGDECDRTRKPAELNATADFLVAAGARPGLLR